MDYEQRSGEEETQDELTSQSEPAKMCASKRHPLQNSNVRRQIIRPWEDHSPSPTLPNGTTESSEIPTVVESSSVTTAAEALVEMGTGTPPKLNALQDVDSTRHHARLPSTEAVDVIIERGRLLALFERVVVATEEASCEQMERMHATFEHIVFRHRMTTNRSELLVVSLICYIVIDNCLTTMSSSVWCFLLLCVRVMRVFCLCRTWNWLFTKLCN